MEFLGEGYNKQFYIELNCYENLWTPTQILSLE